MALGIPPEMLDRVFEMFAQVNSTLDRSQGGLGIGLALVRNLIELHGGTATRIQRRDRPWQRLHDPPAAGFD